MFGPIGMTREALRERLEVAARGGNQRAGAFLAALDTPPGGRHGGVLAFRHEAPRSSPARRSVARAEPPPPEICGGCDREIGGPAVSRCKCYDPPAAVSPGTSPLAAEAEGTYPAGVALGWKRAREPFSPFELSIARNSVAAHGGAAVVGWQGGIDGQSAFHVCRSLDAARACGAKAIVLDITSEGGSVPAGFAVIRALERLRAEHVPTIARVTHHANSMASVIAVAADYASMAPGASMMVHEASGGRDDHLAILRDKLLGIYEARTLLDRGTLEGYLASGITFDAQAALTDGLVDEVCDANRAEEIARAAGGTSGLYSSAITAARSWRRHVLAERRADAQGVPRCGPRSTGRGL